MFKSPFRILVMPMMPSNRRWNHDIKTFASCFRTSLIKNGSRFVPTWYPLKLQVDYWLSKFVQNMSLRKHGSRFVPTWHPLKLHVEYCLSKFVQFAWSLLRIQEKHSANSVHIFLLRVCYVIEKFKLQEICIIENLNSNVGSLRVHIITVWIYVRREIYPHLSPKQQLGHLYLEV